jgi:acetyl esterase/lipase
MKRSFSNPSLFWPMTLRWCNIWALLAGSLTAASAIAQQKVIPLWAGAAPGSESWTWQEQTFHSPTFHTRVVVNVSRPTLTAYVPDPSKANGTAIVVCPGGGFHFLSIDNEGTEVARWLTARGVTALVLKYRLIRTRGAADAVALETMRDINNRARMAVMMKTLQPMVLADGQQAVRLVRQHAAEWKVAPGRVGMIGFSAGGYVTADVALHHDLGSRPDFAAVIYPALPPRVAVPTDAPPIFIVCASDDPLVPPLSNSVLLYSLWKVAGIPAELHIYARGGHGFGMRRQDLPVDHWIDAFGSWLGSQGLLGAAR